MTARLVRFASRCCHRMVWVRPALPGCSSSASSPHTTRCSVLGPVHQGEPGRVRARAREEPAVGHRLGQLTDGASVVGPSDRLPDDHPSAPQDNGHALGVDSPRAVRRTDVDRRHVGPDQRLRVFRVYRNRSARASYVAHRGLQRAIDADPDQAGCGERRASLSGIAAPVSSFRLNFTGIVDPAPYDDCGIGCIEPAEAVRNGVADDAWAELPARSLAVHVSVLTPTVEVTGAAHCDDARPEGRRTRPRWTWPIRPAGPGWATRSR